MTRGFIEAALAILILVGVTGSGKSLFMELVLDHPVPKFSASTPLAKSSVRSMSNCQVEVEGEDKLEWKIVPLEEMMDIVAEKAAQMGVIVERDTQREHYSQPTEIHEETETAVEDAQQNLNTEKRLNNSTFL